METKYETKETELDLLMNCTSKNWTQFLEVQFKIGDSSVSFYTLRVTIFFDYGFCGA